MARNKSKAGDMPRQLSRKPTGPVTSKVEIPRDLSEQLDAAAKDAGMSKSQLIVSLCMSAAAVVSVDEATSDKLDRLCKKTETSRAFKVGELIDREIGMYQRQGIRV